MAIKEVEKDGKKLLEYRFQPKLEDGTPIGGEQVVYGETNDELMDKAADNYQHLYRKNREFLLQQKIKAPEGTAPAPEVRFKPRPLTAEERMKISREFQDPEKIDAALDLALEAKFGGKPKDVSQSVENNEFNARCMRAAQEAAAWADMHPEFYRSEDNVKKIVGWVENRTMEVTIESLDRALADLGSELERAPALVTNPASPEGSQSKPTDATNNSRIAGDVDGSGQRTARVPTSVKRNTGTTRGAAKKEGMTAEQFRRLSNDDRRKFLREHPEGFTA